MSVERLESEIESKVVTEHRVNWMLIKLTETHWPDRVCFSSTGRTVFIEMKTEKGPIRPGQQVTIEKLRKSGFPVYICRSEDEVKMCLGLES
jgi:hypothetical protein